MGYITNQWLIGGRRRQRRRRHRPVKVSISSKLSTSTSDRDHDLVCNVYATLRSGDFQYMRLSQTELDKLVVDLISGASSNAQLKCAMSALSAADDKDLLAFLRELFKSK